MVALSEEASLAAALSEEASSTVALPEVESRMPVAPLVGVSTAVAAGSTETVASTGSGPWSGRLAPVLGGLPSPRPTTSSRPRS